MDWSVCKRRAADAVATEQAVTFCLYCAVYVSMDSFIHSSSWCLSEVIAILDKDGFTSLASLKHATEDDTKELSLRRALHVLLREVLKELQHEHGGGPLCSGPVSTGHWHT